MNLADTVRSSAGGTATAYPAPGVLVVVPPMGVKRDAIE